MTKVENPLNTENSRIIILKKSLYKVKFIKYFVK